MQEVALGALRVILVDRKTKREWVKTFMADELASYISVDDSKPNKDNPNITNHSPSWLVDVIAEGLPVRVGCGIEYPSAYDNSFNVRTEVHAIAKLDRHPKWVARIVPVFNITLPEELEPVAI